jgi:MOSC domain-containing protein YiiM
MIPVESVFANQNQGLEGDRYQGRNGKRHVTLFQQEHLSVIEKLTGQSITAAMLRRNLLISGINLHALKNQHFKIGKTILLGTGFCHPCSRMESILGPGGYNAMLGHGGLTARIVVSGEILIGDNVNALPGYQISN